MKAVLNLNQNSKINFILFFSILLTFTITPNFVKAAELEDVESDIVITHSSIDSGDFPQDPAPKINESNLTTFNIQSVLKRNDNNEAVKKLKLDLELIGFVISKNPNTRFGPTTEKKVKEFQGYYGLNVTGIVDENTANKINTILDSPFRKGKSHQDVIGIKKDLEILGFKVSNNPNKNYGPTTERKVKEFQIRFDLIPNGIVDPVTKDKIIELLESPLKRGVSRKDVVNLKLKLEKLGFKVSNNPNKNFGPTTEKKVMEFQSYYGLNVTGIVDKDTASKINAILDSPFMKGKSHSDVIGIKKNLEILGFKVSNNPNKNFGPTTERKVKEFQLEFGLISNGIVDPVTKSKIKELLEAPLKRGVSRKDVITLKLKLEKLGFKVSNNPNENFGPSTERKVIEFQMAYGLEPNGIVDRQVLNEIDLILKTSLFRGDNNDNVKQMKLNLKKLGFVVSNNPNNVFGPSTEKTVKEFQKYYGINPDGIVNPATSRKIEVLLNNSLMRGDVSTRVKEVKLKLKQLDFVVSDNPNQIFGPATERVVREFQKYFKLKQTGIIEEKTIDKINEILSSPLQKGKAHKDLIQMKKDLERLGFKISNSPNENFGPTTEKKVKEFQKYYNLKQTGILEEVTLSKIDKILSSPLQKGKKHSDTIIIKYHLEKLNYDTFKYKNTSFGPQTENTVKSFQQNQGLIVNGIADEVTLNKLENIINKNFVQIFIDPGHGGSDPGASSNGLREKDLTLDISERVIKLLSNYKNAYTITSRDSDKYFSLRERTNLANNWNADYFLSIHINAGGGTGYESYVYNGGGVTSEEKDKRNIIHDEITKQISSNDRGKKSANFHVLRESEMPASLHEFLFIDNKKDADELKKESFLNKIAKGIVNGLVKALNLFK